MRNSDKYVHLIPMTSFVSRQEPDEETLENILLFLSFENQEKILNSNDPFDENLERKINLLAESKSITYNKLYPDAIYRIWMDDIYSIEIIDGKIVKGKYRDPLRKKAMMELIDEIKDEFSCYNYVKIYVIFYTFFKLGEPIGFIKLGKL